MITCLETSDTVLTNTTVRFKIDIIVQNADNQIMKTLTEVIHEVDQLSTEDQEGLATHLLAALKGAPLGPDNAELAKREAEIDAGTAELLTHEQLCKAVGR